MTKKFDLVVIGGGSGGYAAARTAASLGLRVAVIDGARELGGLCILRGCMPTKALLESAHRWRAAGEAAEFGLRLRRVKADLPAILRRKDRLIEDFASYRRRQLEHGPFTLLRGWARFTGPNAVEVEVPGAKPLAVEGKAFLIATGSEIGAPPVPGLAEAGYLTSDTALTRKKLPKSLVVLGGGAVAVEFADFYASLGTKVTIVQRSGRLAKEFDPDVSAVLEKAFRRHGLDVHTGTQLVRVEKRGKLKEVHFREGPRQRLVRVAAEEVLHALGRKPSLSRLNLEAAGLRLREGKLRVRPTQQTDLPHIYAVGDAAGPYEIVHLAILQGEAAARNIAAGLKGGRAKLEKMDYRLKAMVLFTDPEVASVGLTETEAREKGLDVIAAKYPFDDHGKSMIMGALDGFVKLVADRRRGTILGGQIAGPHASDLIHEILAVMRYGGTAQELAAMPHYHPTLAEIVTYPAEELAARVGKR
ncbi:MAG: NAD(P)/FAD-dependent oxidoreductase [Verrucomicrobium sp.]|nr:NAD(P)/FAD-dependent oxidoreductase [Verrucomicrobium sp.]